MQVFMFLALYVLLWTYVLHEMIYMSSGQRYTALAAFARMNGPVTNAKLRVIYLWNRLAKWSVTCLFLQHTCCLWFIYLFIYHGQIDTRKEFEEQVPQVT